MSFFGGARGETARGEKCEEYMACESRLVRRARYAVWVECAESRGVRGACMRHVTRVGCGCGECCNGCQSGHDVANRCFKVEGLSYRLGGLNVII